MQHQLKLPKIDQMFQSKIQTMGLYGKSCNIKMTVIHVGAAARHELEFNRMSISHQTEDCIGVCEIG